MTPKPLDVISLAAGNCYAKHDVSAKRVENCYKSGHTSILEHASATFEVKGISRSCSHQLVRHRMASYCQESQRYVKYLDFDPKKVGEYAVIPDFAVKDIGNAHCLATSVEASMRAYQLMVKNGVKPEDARFVLPEAMKTSIVMTMNFRELFHFFDLRTSKRAQWEIRSLAYAIHDTLQETDASSLIGIYDKYKNDTKVD